jgi:hypothetical protein
MNLQPGDKTFDWDRVSLLFVFIFLVSVTFYFREIPFFWDSSLYCGISHFYFNTDFSSFIPPAHLDSSGTPMVFWMYMAVVWKIFGKSLFVSHLALLPFLLGISWEYYKFAKRFLPSQFIFPAMFLLCVEPTFITQSIVMGYDIPKIYFFLGALNAILNNKNIFLSMFVFLLAASSMRGIFLGTGLFIIHLLHNKWGWKFFIREEVKYYLPAIIGIAVWLLFHKIKTGWWIFSPAENFSAERATMNLTQIFKRIIFVFWNLFDFGRISIWITVVFSFVYLKKKKVNILGIKDIFSFIFYPLIFLFIAVVPFSIPMGHKYFIVLFLLSHIALIYLIQNFQRRLFYVLFSVISAILITGNFWIYRQELSNGWDSSLKVLPYFEMQKEIIFFVKEEKINPSDIGTKSPLSHDLNLAYLTDTLFKFSKIDEANKPEDFKYVLLSNISNQFTRNEKEALQKNWKLIKEFKRGQVYAKIFERP